MNPYSIIRIPLLTEKGHDLKEKYNQVVFRVRRDANKTEIRKAVELMFEVKVDGVQVVNLQGKTTRFGRMSGRRVSWKKAYVQLAEGQQIDFLGAE